MEVIQLFDSVTKTLMKVTVTPKVAQRCKQDPVYTRALFKNLKNKKLESNSIKRAAVNENETQNHTEYWNTEETQELIKVFQTYKNVAINSDKKKLWNIISQELEKNGMQKTPYQCRRKWESLLFCYRQGSFYTSKTAFPFIQEMKQALNYQPESSNAEESDDSVPNALSKNLEHHILHRLPPSSQGKSFWSGKETLKLIQLYKKHEQHFRTLPRKTVWEMIKAEMLIEGFQKNESQCANKWKNLTRTYRRKKNSKSATNRFYFFNEMRNVLDNNNHFPHESQEFAGKVYLDEIDDDMDSLEGEENDTGTNEEFVMKDEFDMKGEFQELDEDAALEETRTDAEHDYSWPHEAVSALIKLYGQFKDLPEENLKDSSVWMEISKGMSYKNFQTTAEDCKLLWETLLQQYLNIGDANNKEDFPFYDEIQMVLIKSEKVHKKSCKCVLQKTEGKERRHRERMQVLNRKMDIEDRKVAAFEKYVKYLTEKDGVHSDEEDFK